jgi:hypothetical protein
MSRILPPQGCSARCRQWEAGRAAGFIGAAQKVTVERGFATVKNALSPILTLLDRLAVALPQLQRPQLAKSVAMRHGDPRRRQPAGDLASGARRRRR